MVSILIEVLSMNPTKLEIIRFALKCPRFSLDFLPLIFKGDLLILYHKPSFFLGVLHWKSIGLKWISRGSQWKNNDLQWTLGGPWWDSNGNPLWNWVYISNSFYILINMLYILFLNLGYIKKKVYAKLEQLLYSI